MESDLHFDGINYPVNNGDVDKFEEQNPKVSINVFVIDEVTEQIVKNRALKNKDASCHIDLLRIDGGASHYVYIKHMSRLINSQKSKFCSASFFCKYCQNGFGTPELLKKHYDKGCMEVEGQQIRRPLAKEGRRTGRVAGANRRFILISIIINTYHDSRHPNPYYPCDHDDL